MVTISSIALLTLAIALVCRCLAGGHLSPVEHSYLLRRKQRERRELFRCIGRASLLVCYIALLCLFVKFFR